MTRSATYVVIAIVVVAGVLLLSQPNLFKSDQVTATVPEQELAPVVREPHDWTENEKSILTSIWLENLPPLPADPSNGVADDPAAANFGYHLFFDTRLSSNGKVSCASCHKPELKFTDGLSRAKGVGVTPRKTMTIIGTAYSPWMFWDGRKDSQWSQALGPTESAVEHGGNRSMYVHLLRNDPSYLEQYEQIFGPFPDVTDLNRFPLSAGPVEDPDASAAWDGMSEEDQDVINLVFVNMGKAIAAYERLIMPGPAKFDTYVEAVIKGDLPGMKEIYSESEASGLRLFVGKTQCINCHNGPLLTNNSFHNTGIPPAMDLPPDFGRIEGVMQAKKDPFNCLGQYSDAREQDCAHLRYARTEGQEIIAEFKTPTLRNIAETAPYMHSGQITTLSDAIRHYNQAPFAVRGHSEVAPLNLSVEEMQNLEAFLRTLSGPLVTPQELLVSPWPSVDTGTDKSMDAE